MFNRVGYAYLNFRTRYPLFYRIAATPGAALQDRLNRMREQRQRALEVFARINSDMDELKGIVAVWGQLIDDTEAQSSTPTAGKRPNRVGKYVKQALALIAKGAASVTVQDVVQAMTKNGKGPKFESAKAGLEAGVAREQLRGDGVRFRRA